MSGSFGQTTFGRSTTSFAQPGFGATNTSLFGGQASQASTSSFGNTAPTQSFGTTIRFFPLTGTNTLQIWGKTSTIDTKFQCITVMKEYNESKSLEELRYEDYLENRKGVSQGVKTGRAIFDGTSQSTLFGFQGATSAGGGLLSSGGSIVQTNVFLQSITGTTIKFIPFTGTDTIEKNGQTSTINTQFHCITIMKEYNESKSLEELRYEDYLENKKGISRSTQTGSAIFDGTSQSTLFGFQGATSSTNIAGGGRFDDRGVSFGQTSVFRQSSGLQTSNSMFGKPASTAPFGATTITQSTGFGTFGQQTTLFGANAQQAKPAFDVSQPSTGLFGSTTTATTRVGTQPTGFGGFSAQQPQQTRGIELFLQSPNKLSGFGALTSSSFSFSQNTASNSTSLFGQKPATTKFAIASTTSTSAFSSAAPVTSVPAAAGGQFSESFNKSQATGISFGTNKAAASTPVTTGCGSTSTTSTSAFVSVTPAGSVQATALGQFSESSNKLRATEFSSGTNKSATGLTNKTAAPTPVMTGFESTSTISTSAFGSATPARSVQVTAGGQFSESLNKPQATGFSSGTNKTAAWIPVTTGFGSTTTTSTSAFGSAAPAKSVQATAGGQFSESVNKLQATSFSFGMNKTAASTPVTTGCGSTSTTSTSVFGSITPAGSIQATAGGQFSESSNKPQAAAFSFGTNKTAAGIPVTTGFGSTTTTSTSVFGSAAPSKSVQATAGGQFSESVNKPQATAFSFGRNKTAAGIPVTTGFGSTFTTSTSAFGSVTPAGSVQATAGGQFSESFNKPRATEFSSGTNKSAAGIPVITGFGSTTTTSTSAFGSAAPSKSVQATAGGQFSESVNKPQATAFSFGTNKTAAGIPVTTGFGSTFTTSTSAFGSVTPAGSVQATAGGQFSESFNKPRATEFSSGTNKSATRLTNETAALTPVTTGFECTSTISTSAFSSAAPTRSVQVTAGEQFSESLNKPQATAFSFGMNKTAAWIPVTTGFGSTSTTSTSAFGSVTPAGSVQATARGQFSESCSKPRATELSSGTNKSATGLTNETAAPTLVTTGFGSSSTTSASVFGRAAPAKSVQSTAGGRFSESSNKPRATEFSSGTNKSATGLTNETAAPTPVTTGFKSSSTTSPSVFGRAAPPKSVQGTAGGQFSESVNKPQATAFSFGMNKTAAWIPVTTGLGSTSTILTSAFGSAAPARSVQVTAGGQFSEPLNKPQASTSTTSTSTLSSAASFVSVATTVGEVFSSGFNKPPTTGFSFRSNKIAAPTLGGTSLNEGSLFTSSAQKPISVVGSLTSSTGLFRSTNFSTGNSGAFGTASNTGFVEFNYGSTRLGNLDGAHPAAKSSLNEDFEDVKKLPYQCNTILPTSPALNESTQISAGIHTSSSTCDDNTTVKENVSFVSDTLDTSNQSDDSISSFISEKFKDEENDNEIKTENDSEKEHACGITLRRLDYFTVPSLSELDEMVDDDGKCVLANFIIGHYNFGKVTFFDAIDVAGLDLDSIVFFRHKEVVLYPNDAKKPPVGVGLNRKARVTLEGVWARDKTTRQVIKDPERLKQLEFVEKLKRSSKKINAKFVEYRPETGSWVFEVEHFSKYDLEDSDDDTHTPEYGR